MTDMTPDIATALRKPFPKESIGKLPKGGAMLDYVGHAAVTDRLLTVDPEWTWEPLALGPDGLPAVDRSGNLWIKLTICGVTRLGVGDGKSAKECIGDAIRNAAMRFGVALDLWAKEDLVEFAQAAQSAPRPAPQAPAGKPITDTQSKRMYALLKEAGLDKDQTDHTTGEVIPARDVKLRMACYFANREVGSTSELTTDEADRLIAHLAERAAKAKAAKAAAPTTDKDN